MKCNSNCIWFKQFEKRDDEPSNCGCTKPGWEGYVLEGNECTSGYR
jgi:hypothetical protein